MVVAARLARMAARQGAASGRVSTKRNFSAIYSMLDEFPDFPSASPSELTKSSVSVTKLESGLTVVTEDASASCTVSLTYPYAGSASELNYEGGAALMNKCMSFKSGSGLSAALILRTLEVDGATPFSSAGRHGATLGFTCIPGEIATKLTPLLATSCTFEKWDVKEAQSTAKVLVQDAMSSAQSVLTEQLYAAAYGPQSTLGKTFYDASCSPASLVAFRERTYGMDGAILAATGITDHAAYVAAVESGTAEAPVSATAPEKCPYIGGEARLSASGGFTHVALAYAGPSSTAVGSVLAKCLPGGFYANGMLGIYVPSASAEAGASVEAALALFDAGALTDESVARAKTLAKAEAVFALDAGSRSLSECLTKVVLENEGTFVDVAGSYDAITTAQVKEALTTAKASHLSMAAVGDLTNVPYLASISS